MEGLPMIVGVDGCGDRWIAVVDLGDGRTEIRPITDIQELIEDHELEHIVIDVPIGLTDKGSREADTLARALLKKRGRCAFTAPIRPIINCESWEEACRVRFAIEGKKISKQLFGILDKVRAVDAALRKTNAANIFEGHPEVSFALMNDGSPLLTSKKKSAGRECRRELISRYFLDANARMAEYKHHREDVLDAYAMLWTARRVKSGNACRFPTERRYDGLGLRMEIAG
jgi:predicted RNase H-like nuclease